MRIAAGFGLVLLLFAPAQAQTAWEGFIDGVMEAQQQARHFAGAVVVVVSDGRIAFQKGYGFADFAERQPVDPARTLFRVGSNSKMFVWTAVMQLVEQGRLDLHTDVNRYLKGVQVPPTFPQPITLEHLMTHTPGFEDRIIGLFATSADGVRPLADAVREDMPRRVFASGTVPAYSNYGTALAALVVEQVSGVPYEKYLEDRILAPLGMHHATVRQPVPSDLAMDLSTGYKWAGGRLMAQPFEYVRWAPVGAMSVSGEDMGRFILAHLNDGALGEARILRPETASAMRERLTSFSPDTNGMLHGFIETSMNGQTAYGHGGATIWFHSATTIFPAQNVGVFVAYNTDAGQAAVPQFTSAFVEHYFPSPLPKEPSLHGDARANLERFAGTYAPSRASLSDITTLIRLAGASIQPDAEGFLVLRYQGNVTRWRQVEPLVFAQVDGTRRLVFRENDRGEVVDACAAAPDCVITLLKQPWFMAPMPQVGSIGIFVVIFIAALIGIPVAGVSQRRLAKPRGATWARVLAWGTSALFVAGLVATIAGMADVNGTILFGTIAPSLRLGLTFFVLAAVLTAGLAAMTVLAWTRRWWGVPGRACITIVCAAALGTVVWLQYWKLLGWNY
jgi:CubicO group peptidase (beta-lactamase class C family)